MHWPVLLRGCRSRHSPAIRSNLCRSTLRPPKGCRGFAHLGFRRDRSKMNSKRYSGEANEEFRNVAHADRPGLAGTEPLGGCEASRGVFWAAPIVKAPRVRALGLFLPQGADAGAFLGDLQVAADRVGADDVRVRVPGLSLFERGHLGGGVVLIGVIGDMHVGPSLRHNSAEALRRRCIGLEARPRML